MQAKPIRGNSSANLSEALQKAMSGGYQPTLAIVFLSIVQDREAVCKIFLQHNIAVFGATSSGEFINGQESKGEIVAMLLDIDKNDFSILYSDTRGKDVAVEAKEIATAALTTFTDPAVIMCSTCFSSAGETFDGQALIRNVRQVWGQKVPMYGGMAGDDNTLTGTYVFTNDHSTDEGIIMLVLNSEKITLRGMALSGWKPLGRIRTVTKNQGDWTLTIDDQPAMEMYLRYLGETVKTENDQTGLFQEIGFHYPFLAIGAGDPIIRTVLAFDKERNAIKLDFVIPEGKQLQFTMPPDFDIVETVLDNASSIRKENNAEADALLVFSCMGRLSALGPMAQQENDGLAEVWKSPMTGFYSYGEFGKGQNEENEFHSTTCCWVAINEKK